MISAQDKGKLQAAGPFDCVVIDAPCSGSGSGAASPTPSGASRQGSSASASDQAQVLETGFDLLKPGGTLLYITCSVLPEENTEQVAAFRKRHPEMHIAPYKEQWKHTIGGTVPDSADGSNETLVLTPARHDTDGFFVAVMRKAG